MQLVNNVNGFIDIYILKWSGKEMDNVKYSLQKGISKLNLKYNCKENIKTENQNGEKMC